MGQPEPKDYRLAELSDDDLVDCIVWKSDYWQEAFGELRQRYQGQLFSYIFFNFTRLYAEDLVEEIWIKVVFDKIRLYDRTKGDFKAWLFRLAKNHARDWWRKQFGTKKRGKGWVRQDLTGVTNPQRHQPDQQAERELNRERLEKLIPRLTEKQRLVISLDRYGLTTEQIADELDVKKNAITSLRNRAHKALKRMWEAE